MYAKPISISRLSEVNEQVRVYIERLKSAVVGHSPRMEMEIYEFTTSFLRDHFERRTDSEETEYESRLAVSRHLQVLFASLLFLIDEEIAGRAEVNLSHQIDTSCNNRSSYYIDSTQRTIALRYFFHLVWSSGFSTKSVIAAIFPLLDRGEVSNGGDSTLIENVIADNLLQDGSYRAKRLFVMSVLNAVVLCKPEGLRSLISVVLLSDKVGQEATIEACQKVIPLITQPFGKAFMYNEESNSVFLRAVEMEEQIKRLSEQLLPLFALGTTNIVQTDDVPVVLQKISKASAILPPETLQERLHVCLTLLTNTFISSPHNQYSRQWYRVFFYVNKYLLSPGFMALTLRKKCVTSDETLLALKRLHCLSHGVALGAGAASLCSVMEETAPGLLCLLGIREKLPTEEKSLCEAIVQHIGDVQAGLDVLCRALVKGCTQERTHRFAVENRIEPVILYQDERCDVRERAMGLNFILGQNRSNLSSGLLYCLVEYCASSRVDGVEQGDDDSQLIRIIEEALFHREAEDIFGPSSTVLSILRFLLLVLSLGSVVCEKWALEFLIAALSGDFFAAQTKNLSAQQQTYAKEKLNELRLVVSRACSLNTGGDTFPNSDAFVQCNEHLEKAVHAFADGEEDATSVTAEEEAVRRLEGLKDELFLATAKNFVSHISVAVTNIETLIEESFNTTKPSEGLYPIVQSILLNLVYIIFHINDTTSATRAIQCLTWIGIYRLDSPNSSFLSGVLLKGLTLSPVDYPVGLVKRNGDEQQKTLARIRLLDVVLALCDDDDYHLTLRHLDEACRTALASPFHHLLVSLCRAQEDLSLQAAALHCLGQYTVALYPRVPLRIPLHLAEDVFRQGKHEMVKAAAASMMRCVAALIVDQAAAEDVDIQEVFQLTKAMSNYSAKETTTESFQHADIIRHHGKSACEELVSYFPSLLISEVAQ